MNTIKQLDSSRDNNFDLIRFIAASIVIFSHSYLVTGNFKNEPLVKTIGFLDFGALGVKIFFAISGYLITKSLFRQMSIGRFVWARALRIFPGLFITSVFCALIIGPISTTIPLKTYFSSSAVYNFIWQLSTLHYFSNTLPGTFAANPFRNIINSPIWTLPAELLMYLFVFFLGLLLLLWKRQFKILLSALPLIFIVAIYFLTIDFPSWYLNYALSWGILFALGMSGYFFRDKIILNIGLFAVMLILTAIWFHYKIMGLEYAFDVALAYGIFVFAYHPKLQFTAFRKLGDFSYGLYIYAFPVQQMLVLKFPLLSTSGVFIGSFFTALLLAALSWYLVEQPMLKLKNMDFNKYYIW